MATSSKKKTVVKNKKYVNDLKHLQTLLDFTWKAIDGKSEDLDALFTGQYSRILHQMNKLKQNQ